MERSDAASDSKSDDGRNPFERMVEHVHRRVSGPGFFFVCVGIVLVWLLSVPLWTDLKSWAVVIHTVSSVFALVLLVLLENSGKRAEEAAQEKLNVIAEALADLMESRAGEDPQLEDKVRQLRNAVGLESRH